MLGYISSTRKKSCQACVKAKRRCDLGFPICTRCIAKGLHCKYPNASVCDTEVVVRQTTPDLTLADIVVNGSSDLGPNDSTLDPIFSQFDPSQSDVITKHVLPATVLEALLPQIWEPRIMNQQQVSLVINELCQIVPTMAFTGKTMFMHRELYKDFQPTAYQDMCSLSALYTVKTSRNMPILAASIDAKISALMASSSTWCLTEHMAAVQALMIYQIIRLFDPSLQLQAVADKQNSLLELWTATLWKRSFNEPDPFNSSDCYISWAFQESLRRTVLMSVFLRGAWSALTKNGLCEQVPILGRLPLTREVELFDISAQEWASNTPCKDPRGGLIAYGDLSVTWTHDRDPEKLTDFERILLAACRGDDDPRLLAFPQNRGSDSGGYDEML